MAFLLLENIWLVGLIGTALALEREHRLPTFICSRKPVELPSLLNSLSMRSPELQDVVPPTHGVARTIMQPTHQISKRPSLAIRSFVLATNLRV